MNYHDQNSLIQKILMQYTEKEQTDLDRLKEMNGKVKRPANVFAYTFGIIGAIVMGSGMSLVMTDVAETVGIQNPMLYGIGIGCVGLLMVLVNYPIYKSILKVRRKKYAEKMIALSDKILSGDCHPQKEGQ